MGLVFGICFLATGLVAGLVGLLIGLTRKGLPFTMADLVMSGNLATTDEEVGGLLSLLLLVPTEGKGRTGACLFSLGIGEESDLRDEGRWFVKSRLQSPSDGREVMIAAAAADRTEARGDFTAVLLIPHGRPVAEAIEKGAL